MKNISMVDYPDRATVTRLAFQRVAGKPHLVTEYNHPALNAHAGEGPIFIAAFGALQDWDGIFLYTYSHEEKETKAGCIPGFFSIGPHPTIMANVPAASLLFRRGDLSPAKQVLHVPLPPEKEMELIAEKGHAWGVLAVEEFGVDLKNAMLHRIALDISGKFPAPDAEPVAKDLQTSDTGELSWRLPGKDQGVLELRGSKTKAVIGHVDNQRLDLGHGVRVIVGRTAPTGVRSRSRYWKANRSITTRARTAGGYRHHREHRHGLEGRGAKHGRSELGQAAQPGRADCRDHSDSARRRDPRAVPAGRSRPARRGHSHHGGRRRRGGSRSARRTGRSGTRSTTRESNGRCWTV